MANFGFVFDYSWPFVLGFIFRPVAEWFSTIDTSLVLLLSVSFTASIFSFWLVWRVLAQPRWITYPSAILVILCFNFILQELVDEKFLEGRKIYNGLLFASIVTLIFTQVVVEQSERAIREIGDHVVTVIVDCFLLVIRRTPFR